MGAAFQIATVIEFVRVYPCITCGVEMALLTSFEIERRRDHANFYCPNGHAQRYTGQSKEELLQEQLAAAQKRADEAERRRRADREHLERQAAAARGQVTKIKNRVGNGVCPCCNRTFQNLMRHMTTQHPDFKHDNAETT